MFLTIYSTYNMQLEKADFATMVLPPGEFDRSVMLSDVQLVPPPGELDETEL